MLDLLPDLLRGLVVTLQLTAGGACVALVLAFAGGLGRTSGTRLVRTAAVVYIEIFRGTSALVQLFWAYFVLPFFGIHIEAIAAGILVLGLNIGAYGSEVVRGAIQAVPAGQYEAATALSLSPRRTFWRIALPQALPVMVPSAGNLLIELLKSTALVSLITTSELTFTAQTLRASTLRTSEIFVLVLFIYFGVALVFTAGMRTLEQRLSFWRQPGSRA
ncbi:MAG: ectoine/hydroxyectoine ABC transporter permease subunit EhuC [Vicinamibacteraceae bacterium]